MEPIAHLETAFDGVLAITLLWLAWRSLSSPDLFRGIVLFVAFGLLMALAWVRLDAPDVALAEAAIGAGLTGALLMAALARLRASDHPSVPTDTDPDPDRLGQATVKGPGHEEMGHKRMGQWAMLLSLAIAGLLAAILLSLPDRAPGLYPLVDRHLGESGVSNPVTAVLLNFRGFDTLLEMLVMLLALLGVWSLDAPPDAWRNPSPIVLDALARSLTPVLLVVAVYLLWAGADQPGGAFQAGAVLGAAGVLLLLSGHPLPTGFGARNLRIALVAGLGAFAAVAALTLAAGRQMLEYSPELAGPLILLIESAAMISIGVTLVALFLGSAPVTPEDR